MFSLEDTPEEDKRIIVKLKLSSESMKNLSEIIETVMQSLREVGLGYGECCHQLRREEKIVYKRGLPIPSRDVLRIPVPNSVYLSLEDVIRLKKKT